MIRDREFLKQVVWQRRDVVATAEQAQDVQRLHIAFRDKSVLMSRARLEAEAFLQQN